MALLTQAEGSATVCETVFENRFQHVPELARMGASIAVEGSYRVISAGNGEDALNMAFNEQPDLVILDVRLPRRSG